MRKMKYSGVEWIGKIPEEWNVVNISKIYNVILGKMLVSKPYGDLDTLENYLCAQNINWNGINVDNIKQMYFTPNEKKQYLLQKGDVVVTEGGNVGVSSIYLGEAKPCYIQNAVHRVYSKDSSKYLNKLLYYWMICVKHSGYLDHICNKATIPHYTKEKLSSTPIVLIPIYEQREITDYLDKKCSLIDTIITKEHEIIKKLKQYRQSIINEAVTKGIDKNVKMKDSGVEWIGEIPDEWETKKLKYVAETETKKYSPENGKLNYFALENIVSWESKYIETENEYDLSGSNLCYKDDVVFGKLRPYLAKTFLVDYNRCCSSEFAIFSKYKGIPKYLLYVVTTKNFVFTIDNSTYGIKMPRANIEFINNVIIPNPPISEQQAIADYLDKKCTELDKLVSEKERVIEKLEEYKKSLIYECVTGKKEIINNE